MTTRKKPPPSDDPLDAAIRAICTIMEDTELDAKARIAAAKTLTDLLKTRHRLTDDSAGSFFKRKLTD